MQGTVLVDAEQRRLSAIDGKLTSEVKFFGGLFGHLEKGGTFNVEQKEVSPQVWEVSVMHVHMSGKALRGTPQLFIGATVNPGAADFQAEVENTQRKFDAEHDIAVESGYR